MIRRAGPGDAAAITAIWNHYIRETAVTFLPDEKSVPAVEAQIAADQAVFVSVGDAGVDGFARCFPFRSGAGYRHACEHTVLLAPGLLRRGAGRALMEAVIADARTRGMRALVAGITGENAAGQAFHAAMGFGEVGRLPQVGRKFDRWMDLVLMQKLL